MIFTLNLVANKVAEWIPNKEENYKRFPQDCKVLFQNTTHIYIPSLQSNSVTQTTHAIVKRKLLTEYQFPFVCLTLHNTAYLNIGLLSSTCSLSQTVQSCYFNQKENESEKKKKIDFSFPS